MRRAIIPGMARWSPALLVVAACGAPAAPPAAPVAPVTPVAADDAPVDPPRRDAAGIDWASARYGTDDEALALWAQLHLTGANFELRVGELPEAPAGLREAMAKALLRAGGFACPVDLGPRCVGSELDREMIDYQFRVIPDDATLDDPCMRRVIAFWALDQLDDDTLSHELSGDMVALAALPWPERELNRAALYRMQDPAVRLNMLAAAKTAGNGEIADEMLGGLSADELRHLAIDLHVDGAVTTLGADESTLDVFEAAVRDPALRRDTRIAAVRELAGFAGEAADPKAPAVRRAIAALETARGGDDCLVAGVAAGALDGLGQRAQPAAAPRRGDASVIRWLCMQVGAATDDASAPWATLAGPAGVVIERRFHDPYIVHSLRQEHPDVPDDDGDGFPDLPPDELDPDGDGDPTTWSEVERVSAGDFADAVRGSWDELARAITGCEGTSCKVAGTHVTWTLTFGKSKKGAPVLMRLVRAEVYADC